VVSEFTGPAPERLASLTAARERANERIREVEAEQRQAMQTLAAAREAVAEFYRHGGRPQQREKLETAFTEASVNAELPWPERIEGARRAARDAHQAVQVFVGENLSELVEARQVDGAAAAERINTAAAELLAGYAEWNAITQEISGLAALVGPVRPGDVSYTRTEAVAHECERLLREGGEQAPVLRSLAVPV
jgi:hypothetical protein